MVHVEGTPPSIRQTTSCKRAGKNMESRDLDFQGLTFFPPDGASFLIDLDVNIADE